MGILKKIFSGIKDVIAVPANVGTIIIVAYKYFTIKGRSICILGMPESGKTRILRMLQNEPYDEVKDRQTRGGGEKFESFICYLPNDVEIKVKEGKDLNGDIINYCCPIKIGID